MKILHVTDCYSGGVSRAINQIAMATPMHEHFLLRSGTDQPSSVFVGHELLPRNPLQKIAHIPKYAKSVDAHLIFAHSSFAGLYTRITQKRVPVLYQPHCFAFHDTNRSALLRAVFFTIEQLLAHRTDAYFTLNSDERAAVENFATKASITEAFNKPHIDISTAGYTRPIGTTSNITIVMAGRLTKQKNPIFFAETASLVAKYRSDVEFIWVGGGDEKYHAYLTSKNVKVTGWLNEDDLREKLSTASIYFHSADYEGFPISVLDAAALHVPIIVRRIPCFEGTGLATVDTPEGASRLISHLLSNQEELVVMTQKSQALMRKMPPELFGRIYDDTFQETLNRKASP